MKTSTVAKHAPRHAVLHGILHVVFGLALIAAFSAVIMLLWNWLMPHIFNCPDINFWQALGLFILCRLLFGSRGYVWHRRRLHALRNRRHGPNRNEWYRMSKEERRAFMRQRFMVEEEPEQKPNDKD
jgi:hypothetical protein